MYFTFNSNYNRSKINATTQTTILRWGSTKQLDCSTGMLCSDLMCHPVRHIEQAFLVFFQHPVWFYCASKPTERVVYRQYMYLFSQKRTGTCLQVKLIQGVCLNANDICSHMSHINLQNSCIPIPGSIALLEYPEQICNQ